MSLCLTDSIDAAEAPAGATAGATAWAAAPVFDAERLRALGAVANGSLLKSLLQAYRGEARALIEALAAAAARGDLAQVRHQAHDLKSVSLNLGVMQIVQLAQAIENEARQGALRHTSAWCAGLVEAHARALLEIDRRNGQPAS